MPSHFALLTILVAALLAIAAPLASAQPITYQGRLESGPNTPANGGYDFELRLFDAPSDGNQIVPTRTIAAAPVDNGLFTIHPDFGPAAFTTGDSLSPVTPETPRWLEIAVRPAGVGSYTTLSPRQRIAPAPQAVKALNEHWRPPLALPESTTTLRTQPGVQRAFIGRDGGINEADYFGVTVPLPEFIGGMYVDTQRDLSIGLYGFSRSGTARAMIYYFHNQDNAPGYPEGMHFSVADSDRMSILPSGNVGVGTPNPTSTLEVAGTLAAHSSVTAPVFRYPAPQSRTLVISPLDFHRTGNGVTTTGPDGAWNGTQNDDTLVAPFRLPAGAMITGATFYYLDNSTSGFSLSINRRALNDPTFVSVLSTNTSGADPAPRQHTVTLTTPHAVDENSFYWIRAFIFTWAGDPKVKGVQVHYTVNGPE
jgi:hypothetical protein